jgi:hypothetical protein
MVGCSHAGRWYLLSPFAALCTCLCGSVQEIPDCCQGAWMRIVHLVVTQVVCRRCVYGDTAHRRMLLASAARSRPPLAVLSLCCALVGGVDRECCPYMRRVYA